MYFRSFLHCPVIDSQLFSLTRYWSYFSLFLKCIFKIYKTWINTRQINKENKLSKIYDLICIRSWPKIQSPPTRQKAKVVKQLEDLRTRLMHRRDNGPPILFCQLDDATDDMERGGAIQAAGGLIQKQKLRPSQELDTDAYSSLLAAAQPFHPPASADSCVHWVL